MLIVFRVDSADFMGIGHVMRCMTLASQLKERGYKVLFISKNLPGNINHKIEEKGFYLKVLNGFSSFNTDTNHRNWLGTTELEDFEMTWEAINEFSQTEPEWIVVDHYGLSAQWEKNFVDREIMVLAIDDLANREHFSDILLDQTYNRALVDYKGLIRERTKTLLGTEFALLRGEFSSYENIYSTRKMKSLSQDIEVLVMMGGTDTPNTTNEVLSAFSRLNNSSYKLNVVLGETCPHISSLMSAYGVDSNIKFSIDVNDISSLMMKSDISIGAAGTSSWERCALGLPTLLYVNAENQEKIARNLVDYGAAKMLSTPITPTSLNKDINELLREEEYLSVVKKCTEIINRKGTMKVVEEILSYE